MWRQHVKNSNRRSDPRKHWNLLRGLQGKRVHIAPNQPVEFDGKCYTDPKVAAKRFMSKVQHKLDHNYEPFTAAQTADAIEQSKNSMATGPDGLAPWHQRSSAALTVAPIGA